MRLEDITPNLALTGLEPDTVVTVLAVNRISDDALQVFYQLPGSSEIRSQMLLREHEASLAIATEKRPWSFDGDGAEFIRAVEAKRIDLAYLFDPMMAVHTSNVEPLPHQITAVYESMLPRQPLRLLLADDPGAGKTIMAGLYMRELLLRADSQRLLVVAPGSLVEQWRAELRQKFGLNFHVYSRELAATVPAGNPFEEYDLLIVRLDQFARNPELQESLVKVEWDLVVFDEAHKLASHWTGDKARSHAALQVCGEGARTHPSHAAHDGHPAQRQ